MANDDQDSKVDELPPISGPGGLDIGGIEFDFFDVSLRRSYLEDVPTLLASRVDTGTAFPSGAVTGQLFWRTDSNKLYVFDGTDWRQIIVAQVNGTTRMPGRTVHEK